MGVLGPVAMAAGIAALFVVAANSPETRGPDSLQVLLVTVGAVITFAVGYSADRAPAATATIAAVTLAGTLVAMAGRRAAVAGTYALLWAVITLSIGSTEESPAAMALAFVAGGAVALAALWLAERVPDGGRDDGGPPDRADTSTDDAGPVPWSIRTFAVARAVAAGACVALGYWLFPDHSTWAVLTFVLVLQPPKEQATVVAVGRTLGTAAGVLLGMAVASLVGEHTAAVVVAFVLSGFLMLATRKVNYALSTTFTTTLLLLAQRLLQGDVFSTGGARLAATLLGVAAAFAVIETMQLLTGRHATPHDDVH